MKTPCTPVSIEHEKQIDKMNDLAIEWANPRGKYRNISKRFDSYDAIERNLKTMAQEWLNEPFTDNFYLTDTQWKKLDIHSEMYNKALAGKWSNIKNIVPEGISLQDPTARKFEFEYDSAISYERTQLSFNHEMTTKTASAMREAYLSDRGVRLSIGTKPLNDIRDLQKKILRTESESDRLKLMTKLEDVVASDNGKIIRDFQTLNQMPDADFNQAKRLKRYLHKEYDAVTGEVRSSEYVDLNTNTILAAETSRKQLNRMGSVVLDGIVKTKQLIDTKYDYVLGDKDSRAYKNLMNELNSAKIRIEEGRKKGGYLPRYFLEDVIEMKVRLDGIMDAKDVRSTDSAIDIMAETLESVNSERMLDVMKPRNEQLNNLYNQDPLFVIDQYGKEVTQYNKLATLQKAYIEAMKDIGSADMSFVKGLKGFINEQYTVATKGLGERPQFINDLTRTISAVQIARTMGLNFTGAVRNTSSAVYYVAEMGKNNLQEAQKLIKYDEEIQAALHAVEKEQGYLFPDISRELIAQGLLPAEGINKSELNYDPMTGKITYEGSEIRAKFEDIQNWTVDHLLFFHKFTENLTRNWMFKTAFASKYKQLRDHPEYMRESKTKDGEMITEFSGAEARRFSRNFAQKMVNLYAYEYSIHAKSKFIRGQSFKVDESGENIIVGRSKLLSAMKGAGQQVGFQLMHYPMSLLQTHQRKLKGAYVDFKAGEKVLDSADQMFWLRYAGIFGAGIPLASIAMNIDFNNIIDNDLIRRTKDISNALIADEDNEELQFGLLGQFSGPMVGHLAFAMQVADIVNTDESKLQEIIFGNIDYDDPEYQKYMWYQLGTFPGQVANKLWPSLRNGRGSDVWRHLFKQYPSKFTKKWNEKLYARQPKKRAGRKNLEDKILMNALDLIGKT